MKRKKMKTLHTAVEREDEDVPREELVAHASVQLGFSRETADEYIEDLVLSGKLDEDDDGNISVGESWS